ncbi:MAG: NAD+ synthase [Planctomycetes bacterium]|nr:NAD+ synthase [Planctomycetota bacterium]
MRIALVQFDASVGDIKGNTAKIQRLCGKAFELGADVVVFPEMAVCGYPPEDLLLKKQFLNDNRLAVEQLAGCSFETTIVVGFAETDGEQCFNSAAVLKKGEIKKIYRKTLLPNYGVFDEQRYFKPGNEPVVVEIKGIKVILTICEDIWQLEWLDELLKDYSNNDIILNISASPFHTGKIKQRQLILKRCAKHFNCAIAYCNLVGGQDELVFDGRSMFVDSSGRVLCQAKAFEEDLLLANISIDPSKKVRVEAVNPSDSSPSTPWDVEAEVYNALLLGTRDYIRKNGFSKVIVGLSGGIDSSLTAAIAVDALGAGNVVGVTMPSKFNSSETIGDAKKLADNLGIEFHTIPIGAVLDTFDKSLGDVRGWTKDGTAFENLQARIRGCILMSLSNQFSNMVLTTGNKSETAVGYSTLYGDTAGGFAVLKDVPKTMVYELAEYVNKKHQLEVIPVSVMERQPTAELKENQKDTDTLPEYDVLDEILKGYIEQEKSLSQIMNEGTPENVAKQVISMVDRNEYKRRQSPPGIKITPKAFGRDRRMPVTNHYTS